MLQGQTQSLIEMARKLRQEAGESPGCAGELMDRAAEVLCVASNLITMLARATREEVEELREEFRELDLEASSSEGTISPFALDRCIEDEK